jgi:hypothetical protein
MAVTTKLKITLVDSSSIASGSTVRKPVRRDIILHADKRSSRSRPASVFVDLLYCSAGHAPTYSQRVDTKTLESPNTVGIAAFRYGARPIFSQ